MKKIFTRTLEIALLLDSSEMTIFQQGGRHSTDLKQDDDGGNIYFDDYDKITCSVQLQKGEQGRFDFINSEAQKHRAQWDEINAREKK